MGGRTTPQRRIDPFTAVGALLILIGGTALTTYLALIVPGRIAADAGPPEEFLIAATQQAERQTNLQPTLSSATELAVTQEPMGVSVPTPTAIPTVTPGGPVFSEQGTLGGDVQPDEPVAVSDEGTSSESGEWALPEYVDVAFWLSIPAIELEAPIIALAPRERDVGGQQVLRLPVPNSYSVAWDTSSATPGFAGNTVLTGHNNLYGGVFKNLENLGLGAEISVWTERGVFSYRISQMEYVEEDGQPLAVRKRNAQWLNSTTDQRFTLITCWPHDGSSHRLIIVAKP